MKKKKIDELKFLNFMREYMLFLEKFYTAGKNFTLPPVVPVVTNLTSAALPKEKKPTCPSLQISLINISSKADRMPKSPACWSG